MLRVSCVFFGGRWESWWWWWSAATTNAAVISAVFVFIRTTQTVPTTRSTRTSSPGIVGCQLTQPYEMSDEQLAEQEAEREHAELLRISTTSGPLN